jgi:hypothetical protein
MSYIEELKQKIALDIEHIYNVWLMETYPELIKCDDDLLRLFESQYMYEEFISYLYKEEVL